VPSDRYLYAMLLAITLVRVVFARAVNDGAAAMLGWSATGLLLTRRAPRIPRAILVASGSASRATR
jgi:hypothetical protein